MAEQASLALRAVPDLESSPSLLFSERDERALIGAEIEALPATREQIMAAYQPDDLLDPRCGFADGIVRRMVASGVPVDRLSVTQFAVSRGLIKPDSPRIALASWIDQTCEMAPVPASGSWYAAVVVEQSVRRQLKAIGERLVQAAQGGSVLDLATVVSEAFTAALAAVGRLGDGR